MTMQADVSISNLEIDWAAKKGQTQPLPKKHQHIADNNNLILWIYVHVAVYLLYIRSTCYVICMP